jgi:hypothetical protein
MRELNELEKCMIAAGVCGVIAFGTLCGIDYDRQKNKIERYADPNKIEIVTEDIDGNGQRETLMRYDGKSYILQLNENGKPELRQYKIKPATPSRIEVID